ncbi:glucan endo-1,3-beta-glucosidase, acidic [Daucus carota subsp. sativus]|uniref:glucan endo-1,3-beta-glucosidase, acidic n=1 Tax=Daucus carota subsp. sativus TaxID=79200 RepID=UPI0007EF45C5|nr:PREDICTED: glucan endo-1,3-beta-glucosidase, acidic-like [Daucus carota subsp. sativus]
MFNFLISKLTLLQLLFLIIGIVFKNTGPLSLRVWYDRDGNNLPIEERTVYVFKAKGIRRMTVYDPVPPALEALSGSNIEIIVGVPNLQLQSLQTAAGARTWVRDNIQNYMPGVRFRYIAVGNEVDPNNPDTSEYVGLVLPAMKNVHDAIVAAGLQNQIKVSTATYLAVTSGSPPSQGSFKENAKEFMEPIIRFLAQNNLPLLANIYPYLRHLGTPQGDPRYSQLTERDVVLKDPVDDRLYKNLFEALLDTLYSAVERSGGRNIEIVVSESGWPSSGDLDASPQNAETHLRNLMKQDRTKGTPKRPGKPVETYLFAMLRENLHGGSETERHLDLYLAKKEKERKLGIKTPIKNPIFNSFFLL